MAGDQFEDQVREIEIAARYQLGDMNAGEPRHDHLFDLERDDGGGILAVAQQRNLHYPGRAAFQRADASQACHAFDVNTFVKMEPANGRSDSET